MGAQHVAAQIRCMIDSTWRHTTCTTRGVKSTSRTYLMVWKRPMPRHCSRPRSTSGSSIPSSSTSSSESSASAVITHAGRRQVAWARDGETREEAFKFYGVRQSPSKTALVSSGGEFYFKMRVLHRCCSKDGTQGRGEAAIGRAACAACWLCSLHREKVRARMASLHS